MDIANNGSTALHLASISGSLRTIQLFLDHGSEINAVTRDGSTVLHHALLEFDEGVNAIVDLLLQRGVDLSKAREDGIMPIHLLIAHSIDGRLFNEQEKATLTGLILNERSTTVSEIIQCQSPADCDVLVAVFETFLAHDMDLGSQSPQSKTVLRSLAHVWRTSCLKQSKSSLTTMMRMAMEKVPLAGPLHIICIDPDLTISALLIEDEELVHKFLEHSPDVDAKEAAVLLF